MSVAETLVSEIARVTLLRDWLARNHAGDPTVHFMSKDIEYAEEALELDDESKMRFTCDVLEDYR